MKYNINLHGRAYEVEVEFAKPMTRGEFDSYAPAPAAPAPAAPAAAPVSAAPVQSASVPVEGEVVAAPMPGNILKVNVRPGDGVAEGSVLVILEAMKMENEILAPRAGRVAQVLVSEGTAVDTGAALVTLG